MSAAVHVPQKTYRYLRMLSVGVLRESEGVRAEMNAFSIHVIDFR